MYVNISHACFLNYRLSSGHKQHPPTAHAEHVEGDTLSIGEPATNAAWTAAGVQVTAVSDPPAGLDTAWQQQVRNLSRALHPPNVRASDM